MLFALGVITGIAICTFIAVIIKTKEVAITRTIKQAESKFKQKGNILEPESEEIDTWIENLSKEI